ncbi:MAG: Spy/CpxP family protein refolding chaperone [Xanthobacteraceae bacterium]
MSIKLGIAVFVLATALATTTYAASKSGGSKGGGSSHGSSHSSGGHSSGGHSGHSGGHEAKAGHEGKGGHGGHAGRGGHGGSAHAGFAGAFRNPLFWLYWPFAYYAGPDQLALTCGEDVIDIASMPLDQFRDAIHPTEELAAALDDLGLAVVKATQDIKIACPAEVALTAPGRMAAMQRRIEAMIAAVEIVQPALEKFYGLLNDEQKARVNALASAARESPPGDKPEEMAAENCGPSQLGGMELPAGEIDKAVHLTDPERTGLVALQNTDTQAAADLLKASCGAEPAITPPGRLAAVHKRLDVMLAAVKTVSGSLNDFYGTLSDEQKAKFEAIGPIADSEPEVVHAPVRRVYGPPPIGAVIRSFVPFR